MKTHLLRREQEREKSKTHKYTRECSRRLFWRKQNSVRCRGTWGTPMGVTSCHGAWDSGVQRAATRDSLFKAVRCGEHPAPVEQAPSAGVGTPQAYAALPRPAPALCILSAHHTRPDGPLATRPWDGQTDRGLSYRRHTRLPTLTHLGPRRKRSCPGNRMHLGVRQPRKKDAGDPPNVVCRRPPLPLPQRAHQLHVSNDEFSKPGAREMKR